MSVTTTSVDIQQTEKTTSLTLVIDQQRLAGRRSVACNRRVCNDRSDQDGVFMHHNVGPSQARRPARRRR